MAHQDAFGCAVTTHTADVLAPWRRTALGFLAHGADTPTHLAESLRVDPGFPLAHACQGLFSLLLARRELYGPAREALAAAQDAAAHRRAHRRELLYIAALAKWLDGCASEALIPLQEILLYWPQDALAMKLDQSIRFMLGDRVGMRASVERIRHAYDESNPGFGYLLGCYAFALEEFGEYSAAEAHARRAIALAPDDAWGLHAIAHIHDMTGQNAEGIRFINAHHGAWSRCNNFRYHVWWHLALLHLDMGAKETALALYDTRVRADKTDDFRDIANAASLLARLQVAGVSVGDRWDELAALCAARTGDGCLIFADLHYLLALHGAGAEQPAKALMQRMQGDSMRNSNANDAATRQPGLAVAKAIAAHYGGQHRQALAHFEAARADMQALGGSHAQRDVFTRLGVEAALRCGNAGAAQSLLDQRLDLRGAPDGYAGAQQKRIAAIASAAPRQRTAGEFKP